MTAFPANRRTEHSSVGEPLTLQAVEAVANILASRYLDDYTAQLDKAASLPGLRAKEVNDALWGTIALTPIEVAFLDSPLLQRLRFIRQLGAVHWVYPGAVHTRFEHTIGTLFQVQQLVSALNSFERAASPDGSALVVERDAQLLRLCALMRDTGHVAFSQVSESAIEEMPVLATLSKSLTNELRWVSPGEDASLSEVISYFIVRSPAMRNLLRVLIARLSPKLDFERDQEPNLEAIIGKMSLALIGRKIDDRVPLLHELISGPYDASKLDSLVRDSKFAGIPTVLDIQRLMQKLAVERMTAKELPTGIAGIVQRAENDPVWLFGIKASAASALDELQLSSVLVSTKIYQHSKVVAVEQMIRSFVDAIFSLASPEVALTFLYAHSDDAVLSMDDEAIGRALGLVKSELEAIQTQRLQSAQTVLSGLRERRLWVRAFQLSGPDASLGSDHHAPVGLIRFRDDFGHVQRRYELMSRVRDEVHALLGSDNAAAPSRISLDSLILARPLRAVSGETQIGRALLMQRARRPYPLSELMLARGNWVELYMSSQPKGYIFCPAFLADAVYVAVEKVARIQYGASLPTATAEASKRDHKGLLAFKRRLPPPRWVGVPHDIRPMPSRLEQADVHGAISRFDKTRAAYQEPSTSATIDSFAVHDAQRTLQWLRQFEDPASIECALHLLDHVRMLGREDTIAALRSLLEAQPQFCGAWVVPFGNVKDSSVFQAYFSADLEREGIARQGTLADYVAHGQGAPLIFIDDFIGSGSQATDILAAWFERADLRKSLGEQRDAVPDAVKERLRAVPMAFLFVAGWSDGFANLQAICKALGLAATVHCHLTEEQLPFAEPILLKKFQPDEVARFLDRCRAIGEDLIRSEPRSQPLSDPVVHARALGYGGRAMLLASFVNVPTQTMTAIWLDGTVDGVPWWPLLRRRKKA